MFYFLQDSAIKIITKMICHHKEGLSHNNSIVKIFIFAKITQLNS